MDYSKIAVIIENSCQRRKLCSAVGKNGKIKVISFNKKIDYPVCYTLTMTDMGVLIMIPERLTSVIQKGEKNVLPLAVFLKTMEGEI